MQHILPKDAETQFGVLLSPQTPQPHITQHLHQQAISPMPMAQDQNFAEKRITIWNRVERRKISGNAAPMGKNLPAYLEKHPDCEVFVGQDKDDGAHVMFSPPPLGGPFSMFAISNDPVSGETPNHLDNGLSAYTSYQPFQYHHVQHSSQSLAHTDRPTDNTEKRVTIWHTKEKRKISGNAAPMEKNLKSYLNTHPDCEVYTCQDKTDGSVVSQPSDPTNAAQNVPTGFTQTNPVTIPEGDDEEANHFEDSMLTPPGSFGFESRLESRGIPITSPALASTNRVVHMDMSPVDSLASSFTMDFSLGSQPHSLNDRMRQMRGSNHVYYGTPNLVDIRIPETLDNMGHHHHHHAHKNANKNTGSESDRSDDDRQRSNTVDDFGVMGKPDGF